MLHGYMEPLGSWCLFCGDTGILVVGLGSRVYAQNPPKRPQPKVLHLSQTATQHDNPKP